MYDLQLYRLLPLKSYYRDSWPSCKFGERDHLRSPLKGRVLRNWTELLTVAWLPVNLAYIISRLGRLKAIFDCEPESFSWMYYLCSPVKNKF